MINKIHSYFHNPNKGWDPVSEEYAQSYSAASLKNIEMKYIEELILNCGTLENKTIIDLGGGPGQYSIEFAKRGAKVTWFDISSNYMKIAKEKALNENVEILFRLNYMDNAIGNYDIVFNNICFYYSISDNAFFKTIYNLLNENGVAFLVLHNEKKADLNNKNILKRIYNNSIYYLNNYCNIKIGHPPFGRHKLHKMISKYSFKRILIDDSSINTKVVLCK